LELKHQQELNEAKEREAAKDKIIELMNAKNEKAELNGEIKSYKKQIKKLTLANAASSEEIGILKNELFTRENRLKKLTDDINELLGNTKLCNNCKVPFDKSVSVLKNHIQQQQDENLNFSNHSQIHKNDNNDDLNDSAEKNILKTLDSNAANKLQIVEKSNHSANQNNDKSVKQSQNLEKNESFGGLVNSQYPSNDNVEKSKSDESGS